MNADGSNRRRLTETPLTYLAQQDLIVQKEIYGVMRFVPNESKHWNNGGAAWSPDGQSLAFLTDRTGQWEIWIMNADGSDQRPCSLMAYWPALPLLTPGLTSACSHGERPERFTG